MARSTPARRVLLYGDFGWDRLAASYRRAFEELGHTVVPFDTRGTAGLLPRWLRGRVGERLCRERLALRRRGARRLNAGLLAAAHAAAADLVLLLNGDLVMPETVARLRETRRVFVFHADNPFPESPNHRPEHLPVAGACDAYFLWSRVLCDRLARAGAARVEYLPFGWDPEVFPHRADAGEAEYDVTFVGGWDREREAWLEAVAARFRLSVWGPPYWTMRTRRGSPLRRCWRGELRGGAAAGVIARSRITLNLLRLQNLPDGTNMRTFEVPGAGGVLLATRSRGAVELFPEREAAAYFATPAELCAQIDELLAAPAQRRRLAASAHARVRDGHRYRDRAARVLEVFEDMGPRG